MLLFHLLLFIIRHLALIKIFCKQLKLSRSTMDCSALTDKQCRNSPLSSTSTNRSSTHPSHFPRFSNPSLSSLFSSDCKQKGCFSMSRLGIIFVIEFSCFNFVIVTYAERKLECEKPSSSFALPTLFSVNMSI